MTQPLPGLLGFDAAAHCYTVSRCSSTMPGALPGTVAWSSSRSRIQNLLLKLYYPRVRTCFYFIMSERKKKNNLSFNTHLATDENEMGLWCMSLSISRSSPEAPRRPRRAPGPTLPGQAPLLALGSLGGFAGVQLLRIPAYFPRLISHWRRSP